MFGSENPDTSLHLRAAATYKQHPSIQRRYVLYFQKNTSCRHSYPKDKHRLILAESQNSKASIDKTIDLNERNSLIRVLYKNCY